MRALKEELVVTGDQLSVDLRYYQSILNDCLPELNERQRTMIFLRFWQSLTIAQVASFLKISWDEADRQIDGAVHLLRKLMQEHKYYKNPPSPIEKGKT